MFRSKINISFLANPFYVYPFAFILAFVTYFLGWCNLYPKLSANLIIFLIISFLPFLFLGYNFEKKKFSIIVYPAISFLLNDIVFFIIIILGATDIAIMGYLPILDKSHNYKEFGAPVIDVLFNTLSIFFSIVFLQSFLCERKKRFLAYILIILAVQILLYRRATLVWIIISGIFFIVLNKKKISIGLLILGIIMLPLFSYTFGLLGNKRSNLSQSDVINNLGASNKFKNLGISHNHYMTYLYLSSPVANLQINIKPEDRFFNNGDFVNFVFYCLVPQSITMRLEKGLNLSPPGHSLITPGLIVGSCFMMSYCLMGWFGMIVMVIFILFIIWLCLKIVCKWNTFYLATISILSTTISFLIFDNMLNRLDMILMLFIYPAFWHFVNSFIGGNLIHFKTAE